jgi:hypothetical protein
MLFTLSARRSGTPVTVTNYIKQHKKSTGFRDAPVVFKNRVPEIRATGSVIGRRIGTGVHSRYFQDHFQKNPPNNLIFFWKNQYFYKKTMGFHDKELNN